ncbi:hypothetical protein AB5I41_24080 [Sphingomonas sp. MMS24-JH45]
MRLLRLDPTQGYKKCARLVGDVIGSARTATNRSTTRWSGSRRPRPALPAGRRAGQFRQHRRR